MTARLKKYYAILNTSKETGCLQIQL